MSEEAPIATFPLRVAAIDVGSNAIRFVAAEFVSPTHWVELEHQRFPVRLGHNVFLTGNLDEGAMNAAVEAMSFCRRSLDQFGVPQYRAVATSAVRESRNGGMLVDRIRRESGISLETITGSEESRLVWTAGRSRFDMGEGTWVMADLGGGSLEISLVSDAGVHWVESHTMGTVRILEQLGGALQGGQAPDSHAELARFRSLVAEYAGTLRMPDPLGDEPPSGLLATGGNIESLAKLAGCAAEADGASRLSLEMLRYWISVLSTLSVSERMERFGLRKDRADVILPAALMYERVAILAGVDEIRVPHIGVKEGVLLDVVDDLLNHSVHVDRMEQQALSGALALGRRFNFDEAHGKHVGRLALSLFDQLLGLHELGEDDRRVLLGAAVLHDVGQFVSYRKHHKHSLYLIYNSELPNYSPGEITLMALVARYHRRAEPKASHYLFSGLDEEEQERVRRLSALLRVADALDREHLQRVPEVWARVGEDELVLQVDGRGDLLLEHWAIETKAKMFESVFGLSVKLIQAQASLGPHAI